MILTVDVADPFQCARPEMRRNSPVNRTIVIKWAAWDENRLPRSANLRHCAFAKLQRLHPQHSEWRRQCEAIRKSDASTRAKLGRLPAGSFFLIVR